MLFGYPHCSKRVDFLDASDFDYYDKDGFELNIAEQKFYRASGHPIDLAILNHHCWQEPWFELEKAGSNAGLILDHALVLHRCSYSDQAKEQLQELNSLTPKVNYLLNCRAKWGYDFAMDYCTPEGELYEILHIEVDDYNYNKFKDNLISMEYTIRHTDWLDVAQKIIARQDEWKPLQGFEQNNWKAKFILGWNKAEYTEKVA